MRCIEDPRKHTFLEDEFPPLLPSFLSPHFFALLSSFKRILSCNMSPEELTHDISIRAHSIEFIHVNSRPTFA